MTQQIDPAFLPVPQAPSLPDDLIAQSLDTGRSSTGHVGLPHYFAQELSRTFSSLDAARWACLTTFAYTHSAIPLAQISMDDQYRLHVDGVPHQLTRKAFSDLCAILKIPVPFARDIPTDLTSAIVDRLKVEHQQLIVLVARGDTVVAVVDPLKWRMSKEKEKEKGPVKNPRPYSYSPVLNAELLDLIEKVWSGREQDVHVTVSDEGLHVEIVDSAHVLEPRVGDLTKVGVVVTNSSETGGTLPLASGYTLRLVCTNGATLPADFGLLRFSTDWRLRLERRLEIFASQLRGFSLDMSELRAAYERLAAEYLTDYHFHSLYRVLLYIYRGFEHADEHCDDLLGLDPLMRQEIISQLRARQQRLRTEALGLGSVAVSQPTPIAAWDFFQSITAQARKEPHSRRVALERLAGDLLKAYIPRPN